MKKLISLCLALSLCLGLAVSASAAGTTVTLPEDPAVPGISATLSGVLDVNTVALKQEVGYDTETGEPITAMILTTVYTVPKTGAQLSVTSDGREDLFPGDLGGYRWQNGVYGYSPDLDFGGQATGMMGPGVLNYDMDPSDYMEEYAQPTDIFGFWVCDGLEFYYTYADISAYSVEANPVDNFGLYSGNYTLLNLVGSSTRSVTMDGVAQEITIYYTIPEVTCLFVDYSSGGTPYAAKYSLVAGKANTYTSEKAELLDFDGVYITDYEEYVDEFFKVWDPNAGTDPVYIAIDPGYFGVEVPEVPAPPVFTDVPADAYYAQPVAWAVEKGITNGTSATKFSPNNTCTNAQILTFMWRAAGSPDMEKNPFSNLTGQEYYYDAALWAYENGMVSGKTFDADKPCTRAMTVEYFWKQMGSPATAPSSQFGDVSADTSYASAVAWAVEEGITNGTSATAFSPDKTCTRGQIATFLYRLWV